MAETTKRPRSNSPGASDNGDNPQQSKKAKEETSGGSSSTSEKDQEDKSKMASAVKDEPTTTTTNSTENEKVETSNEAQTTEETSESKPTSGEGEGETSNDNGLPQPATAAEEQPQSIAMRCIILSTEASIIIGKQGKNINDIRDRSGAKLTISETLQGNPERIMTVAGPLDAVSKAFGLVVRRINDEPYDQSSLPGHRATTIKFIVPNSRMGSVIGKAGSKIKEIQEASGARLTAGEQMLPGSTERVLSISGVADAVHIAVFYVGTILMEHQDRQANNMSYRPTAGGAGALAAATSGGRGGNFQGQGGYGGYPAGGMAPMGGAAPFGPGGALPPGSQTQQIFIPNDLVGCIIGKGGQKINEIRQMSSSHIKIMEPSAGIAAGGNGSERLVTITGPPNNIQMAVSLLYQRLEQEKLRLAQGN